jgi:hypothetical protein
MLINTHSHLKRFSKEHSSTIDTLLLLGQLLLTAIAVMVLLSILGWATAINYAMDWCDRLVESSLEPVHPTQSPTVIQFAQQEETVLTKIELTEDIAVKALEPKIPALPIDKPIPTFKNIKKQATRNQMALQSVLR